MQGQLNLFAFKPKIKVIYPIPQKLNHQLWDLIKKTDDRGYSFGKFGYQTQRQFNDDCIVVVIYKDKVPIGFCTISLYIKDAFFEIKNCLSKLNKDQIWREPYIDVWVLPYYRDMGFGSLLVNRANKICQKYFQQLPGGHDKNHSHCWEKRIQDLQKDGYHYDRKLNRYLYSYDYNYYSGNNYKQLSLFPEVMLEMKDAAQ